MSNATEFRGVLLHICIAEAGSQPMRELAEARLVEGAGIEGDRYATGKGYYSDRKPSFTKQEVTLRKEGCEEQSHTFRRNERPDLGAIVSAYYLAFPVLWMTQYKDRHVYEFDCAPEAG